MQNWESIIEGLVRSDRECLQYAIGEDKYCIGEEERDSLEFAVIQTSEILGLAGWLMDGRLCPADATVALEMVSVLQELYQTEVTLESQFEDHLTDQGLVLALTTALSSAYPQDPGEIETRERFATQFEQELKSLIQ